MRFLRRVLLASIAVVDAMPGVNAGPLEDLQPGYWYEVPNSQLLSVNPCPADHCSYSGVEGHPGVINDWNGGAFASRYGTKGGFVVWGGGHGGYLGNEIYVFDVAELRWVRVTDPVENPSCNLSEGELQDGTPCSAHTYDYVEYHPGSNSFVVLGSASNHLEGGGGSPRVHLFSFDTKSWRRGARKPTFTSHTGASSAYDPNRDVFWLLPAYGTPFAKYDPNADGGTGRWTEYLSPTIDIDTASAIDPSRDLFVTVDGRDTHTVQVWELKKPGSQRVVVRTSGDTTLQNSKANGFEWDPAGKAFVGWAGGSFVYLLTPPNGDWRTGTWAWSKISPAPANTVEPTSPNSNGTYSRWRYVPSLDVFVLYNRVTDNVFFYRLSQGGGAIDASISLSANPTSVSSSTSHTAPVTPAAAGSAGEPSPVPQAKQGGGSGMADALSDYQQRASHPDVVRAVSFDSAGDVTDHVLPDGNFERAGSGWDQAVKASGGGSLRFTVPSNSGSSGSGSWRINFSDAPFAVQFGANEEFYVQWRQRFDNGLLTTNFQGGGGWKQVIIGEGDVSTTTEATSCTELELVTQNTGQRGFPQLYHACGYYTPFEERFGASDFKLQNAIPAPYCLYSLNSTGQILGHEPCFIYRANEWMTFQVRVKLGPRGTGSSVLGGSGIPGFINSTVQMWVAREGQPSQLVHDRSGLVLRESAGKEYGKIWLLPYHTGKSSSQSHPVTYTWYDELIVSRSRIADPASSIMHDDE